VVVQAIARRFRERFGDYVPSSQLQGDTKKENNKEEKQTEEVLGRQDEEKQKEKQAQERKKGKKSWKLSFLDWERLVGNRDGRDFNGLMEIKKQAEFVMKMVPSWSLVGLTGR
jgi:hypothetical protein